MNKSQRLDQRLQNSNEAAIANYYRQAAANNITFENTQCKPADRMTIPPRNIYDTSVQIDYRKEAMNARALAMKRATYDDECNELQRSRYSMNDITMDYDSKMLDLRVFPNPYPSGYDYNNPALNQGPQIVAGSRVFYGKYIDEDAEKYRNLKTVLKPVIITSAIDIHER